MVELVDLDDLWTSQEPLEIKNDEYWMKLRVMKDDNGKSYYDILAGKIGERPHLHYGFNLKGDLIFQQPRNQVQQIRREVDSQLYGRISDEKKIIKNTEGKINFVFRVVVKSSTRESHVIRFELRPAGSESPPPDIPM